MEHLFQGQLVLRTRCLECESFTERREDFQDISVPVLDEQPTSPEDLSESMTTDNCLLMLCYHYHPKHLGSFIRFM